MDDDSSSSESSSDADANDAKVSFAPAFKLGALGQSRSERMMRRSSGEQALPLREGVDLRFCRNVEYGFTAPYSLIQEHLPLGLLQ